MPCARKRAVEQIGGGFARRGRLRRLVPAEMPRHQLIGLQHAVALGDRQHAGIEDELQRPLRRLAARPQMLLVDQHVVVDVADGQRAVLPDQPHHLAQIRRLDRGEPFVALALVPLHRREEEAEILRRHVGQRVGPVFEHALVDALGLPQIGAAVVGNPATENVVVAALDHVDGVDLHIAEMLDRGGRRRRPVAERRRRVEPLGAQPDPAGLGLAQGTGIARGIARQCSGFAQQREAESRLRAARCPLPAGSLPRLTRSARSACRDHLARRCRPSSPADTVTGRHHITAAFVNRHTGLISCAAPASTERRGIVCRRMSQASQHVATDQRDCRCHSASRWRDISPASVTGSQVGAIERGSGCGDDRKAGLSVHVTSHIHAPPGLPSTIKRHQA